MKRTGIFGGTFNPVHNGHLHAALLFYRNYKLDELLIIPVYSPPHKPEDFMFNPAERLEMCRLAFEEYMKNGYNITISDIEVKKETVSYTYNTLTELKEIYPCSDFFFLIGTDLYATLDKWHRCNELFGLCEFVVVNRRNSGGIPPNPAVKAHFMDIDCHEMSSTEIRTLMQQGADYSAYLPERVYEYIENKRKS